MKSWRLGLPCLCNTAPDELSWHNPYPNPTSWAHLGLSGLPKLALADLPSFIQFFPTRNSRSPLALCAGAQYPSTTSSTRNQAGTPTTLRAPHSLHSPAQAKASLSPPTSPHPFSGPFLPRTASDPDRPAPLLETDQFVSRLLHPRSANMSFALVSRRSALTFGRRAVRFESTTSEKATEAAKKTAAKASELSTKASEGLSRVSSAAGPALAKYAKTLSSTLGRVGGRTGKLIAFAERTVSSRVPSRVTPSGLHRPMALPWLTSLSPINRPDPLRHLLQQGRC